MNQKDLHLWNLGFSDDKKTPPLSFMPSEVPGSVHLDVMEANNLPDFRFGNNVTFYDWIETKYWHYTCDVDIDSTNDTAILTFESIDYEYSILVNEEELLCGEGMYTVVELDVSRYAGETIHLHVIVHPVPIRLGMPKGRAQASCSCKPIFAYQWDWCPRLISMGICGKAYIKYISKANIQSIDITYQLNDILDCAKINVQYQISGSTDCIKFELLSMDNISLLSESCSAGERFGSIDLSFENPDLWWPFDHGRQTFYKIAATLYKNGSEIDRKEERIGFRRIKLITNEGTWRESDKANFPKTCNKQPITIEINGKSIFAKGSNWVPPEMFPSQATYEVYYSLLLLAREANMNILRLWGGGYINPSMFYDICDELGIMVWQEFPLACAKYPDDPSYLTILDKESVSIIKRIRNHPCLAIWCGGNELFNSWSGMTDQSLALRVLNSNCLKFDTYTPFIPTSPLYGMGHGHYETLDVSGKEILTLICEANFTAYTEFGCAGPSDWNYLKTFIPEEEMNTPLPGTAWETHHALNAWNTQDSWFNETHIQYYAGKSKSLEETVAKGVYVQSLIIQHLFEEARRQWPYCSMALNWCFNEPWPTAAGNSIVNYPAIPKPAYFSVKEGLRSAKSSLRIKKLFWESKEQFLGEIWILNDSKSNVEEGIIVASVIIDGIEKELLRWMHPVVPTMENLKGPSITFLIPSLKSENFDILLKSTSDSCLDANYTVLSRNKAPVSITKTQFNN